MQRIQGLNEKLYLAPGTGSVTTTTVTYQAEEEGDLTCTIDNEVTNNGYHGYQYGYHGYKQGYTRGDRGSRSHVYFFENVEFSNFTNP